ncbi:MAG: N-acetylneuraminate synthase family protein [Pseudomonadota bacterium]
MLITRKLTPFVVFEDDSLVVAMDKMNENKSRVVFVISDGGVLEGVLTDGDIRRWGTTQGSLDLQAKVSLVMNRKPLSLSLETSAAQIQTHFSKAIDAIPLLDKSGRVAGLALSAATGFRIGDRVITEDSPCFIIAEIGNNHNGDAALARRLVDEAVAAGADCAKFQMRDMSALYTNRGRSDDLSADLGAQYTLDLLARFQLPSDEMLKIFDYCASKGLTPLCTPWDIPSLNLLERYGMEGYKIASADLTNTELLGRAADTAKPLICSTGMSTEDEIIAAARFLRERSVPFVMLHCNSTYPTPYKDVNLPYMNRLKEISGSLVGYSGHERGYMVPIAAVALGAKVIEKHFSVDRGMEGSDHKVSLLPGEFAEMVNGIRALEESMRGGNTRSMTQGERMNREVLGKSLFSRQALKAGAVVRREDVEIKSPGTGLPPYRLDELVGIRLHHDMKAGEPFFESDLKAAVDATVGFKFKRPVGIPVRYHDYSTLAKAAPLDFVEFHLSYKDMEADESKILPVGEAMGFAVHAPELFFGDHVLDLASDDPEYYALSLQNLIRVAEVAERLKRYFPSTARPFIVVNAGGFSFDGFISESEKQRRYAKIETALMPLVAAHPGVEFTIQSMPPYPWHFGGQRFHNLFVSAEETAEFCARTGLRICLDLSHALLACNANKWDIRDYVRTVAQHTAYMHIADSSGVDGEGLQIGEGDGKLMLGLGAVNEHLPTTPFIPEVWQGHKNGGQGFWVGLDRLQAYLH